MQIQRLESEAPLIMNDPSFSYFHTQGVRDLMYSMLKQSIQDVAAQQKAPDELTREMRDSAQWLKTKAGSSCVAFLMPDVSPHLVIARIYKNPNEILQALKDDDGCSRSDAPSGASADSSVFGINMDGLTDFADEGAFVDAAPSFG